MADQRRRQEEHVFCHACQSTFTRGDYGLECPDCHSGFVEIIDEYLGNIDSNSNGDDDDNHFMSRNDIRASHPLNDHDPWQAEVPDPDEPDIEHVEWNPAPGFHCSRTSYRSSTSSRGPRITPNSDDLFAPIFSSFSTMLQGPANPVPSHLREGQARLLPRTQSPNHVYSQEHTSHIPVPDNRNHNVHHHHVPWSAGQLGSRNVFTATGHWPPVVATGAANHQNAGSLPAVLAAMLQSMVHQDGGQPLRSPNIQAILASILGNGAHGDAVYSDEALDRIITQMMEQNNINSAPGPASASAIANLPKQTADKNMMGQDGKAECSVCMDNVQIGDEVTVLPCKHWFHGDCVGAWLKEHDTCPQCRQGIMPKDSQNNDVPRSPSQTPRYSQGSFLNPINIDQNSSRGQNLGPIDQQTPIPGAFLQSGIHQPYSSRGVPNYPEPQRSVTPDGQSSQPLSLQHRQSSHRRRSSPRERSSGNGGEGSSSGQGVTGWLRSLRGGNSNNHSGDR